MPDPYISVVVTAYTRRQYLPEALRSLENQILDKSKFEVIVVKNFEHPKNDEMIRRNGWKEVTFSESLDIISMTVLGVEESRGDVVTFLDDDDMYAPERLSYIYVTFRSVKDLIWFHNLQYYIDRDGRLVPSEDPRALFYTRIQPPFSFVLRSDDRSWLRLIRMYGGLHHNSSSIAVARHVAEGLRGMRGTMPDLALTTIAGAYEGLMYHTAKRLTYYRIHGGGISRIRDRRRLLMDRLATLTLLKNYRSKLRERPLYLLLLAYVVGSYCSTLELAPRTILYLLAIMRLIMSSSTRPNVREMPWLASTVLALLGSSALPMRRSR